MKANSSGSPPSVMKVSGYFFTLFFSTSSFSKRESSYINFSLFREDPPHLLHSCKGGLANLRGKSLTSPRLLKSKSGKVFTNERNKVAVPWFNDTLSCFKIEC